MVTDMATIYKHLGVGAGVDAGLFVLFRTKRVCHLMRVRVRENGCVNLFVVRVMKYLVTGDEMVAEL